MSDDALAKIKAENTMMEAEINALLNSTQASVGGDQAATKVMVEPTAKGISVLSFGKISVSDEAGKDLGSSWCPPQCSRRTVLGGFFTS